MFRSAKVIRIDGQPGMFDVTLSTEAGEHKVRAGAIVVATGWKPYDASLLVHLGYGASPDVITNLEFERMAAAGKIVRPSNGNRAASILFVQCAGSRDPDHLPYCSSVCCMETLKQITYIREQDPEAQVYVVYKDMRTPGQYERFYRTVQDQPLNFFTKGEVAAVTPAGGKLSVTVNQTLLGESIALDVDLVVLATGMVPNGSEQILNLAYRQGPELPVLSGGFPDSHFICFPYETRRTGIYAAGAVRSPMDVGQARRDAIGRRVEGDPVRGTGGRKAEPCTRAAATCPIPRSSCSAAPSASAAPRSAPSARSTRTPRGRRSPTLIAAAAAACAWAPARSASFPSRTTPWT